MTQNYILGLGPGQGRWLVRERTNNSMGVKLRVP